MSEFKEKNIRQEKSIKNLLKTIDELIEQSEIYLEQRNELLEALKEIQEYQMNNIQLARTTTIYKIAEKAIQKTKDQ